MAQDISYYLNMNKKGVGTFMGKGAILQALIQVLDTPHENCGVFPPVPTLTIEQYKYLPVDTNLAKEIENKLLIELYTIDPRFEFDNIVVTPVPTEHKYIFSFYIYGTKVLDYNFNTRVK